MPVRCLQVKLRLDFILDERSRELIYEEHRRYNIIKDRKIAGKNQIAHFHGGELIGERDVLYPIPQIVIDANLTKKCPRILAGLDHREQYSEMRSRNLYCFIFSEHPLVKSIR